MTVPMWPVGRGAPPIGADIDALCLVFSRAETSSLRVSRSVDDLMLLTDDDRLRRQLVHGVFFSFEGWEDDPREVMFIPECRETCASSMRSGRTGCTSSRRSPNSGQCCSCAWPTRCSWPATARAARR